MREYEERTELEGTLLYDVSQSPMMSKGLASSLWCAHRFSKPPSSDLEKWPNVYQLSTGHAQPLPKSCKNTRP